jgi:LuxR family transcriptional regulator, quorum-sensing system regulator CinR
MTGTVEKMTNALVVPQGDLILTRIATVMDINDALREVCSFLQVRHLTYLLAQNPCMGVTSTFVRTTYPAEWVSRYLTGSYEHRDPVFARGLCGKVPFFWSEASLATADAREFFAEAKSHGVGGLGYCVPIADRLGLRAMLCLNHSGDAAAWRSKVAEHRTIIAKIADAIHGRALGLLRVTDVQAPLSPREIECLTWAAQGKDALTIASILEISDHTARDHLRFAKKKLGCTTIAQAVYKAGKLNLINH